MVFSIFDPFDMIKLHDRLKHENNISCKKKISCFDYTWSSYFITTFNYLF